MNKVKSKFPKPFVLLSEFVDIVLKDIMGSKKGEYD